MKQKATESEYKNGLTLLQEKAAVSLASGKTVTDTAGDLNISRSTVYRLLDNGLFMAYYNLLCREIKMNVKNSLLTLREKAFEAIEKSLDSDNDTTRLKAATWVIEKIQEVKIDNTDPIEAIKLECIDDSYITIMGLDESEFKRRKKEYGF